jgi:uncharacterized protein (TIGR03083 family)
MNSQEIWRYIHAERGDLADTLSSLSPEQWTGPSWCTGWTVHMTAGHVLHAAEQTPLAFYKELAGAGFKFATFTGRGATKLGALSTDELVRRLRARTSTTNRPPAPVLAMLGEIIVHGADIRRPLGIEHATPQPAVIAVADGWKKSNLLIGAKRRISGLRLQATDSEWAHGDGPVVAGPLQSLVLAMTGRAGSYDDLTGDGVAILRQRA